MKCGDICLNPRMILRLFLLLPLLLASCGDLPEPFIGNPGATARRLAVPVTPLLAVALARDMMLPTSSGLEYAERIAASLQKEEVPALARFPRWNDWRLVISAARSGGQIVPHYKVTDPSGKELGSIDGVGLPAGDWQSGQSAVLKRAETDALPKILALLTSIRATRDRADPNSLLNRVAKLYVPEVTGAPGDGNSALTRLIRTRLTEFGPIVQVTPENTDFTVKGEVIVTPQPKSMERVEIAWTVIRPSGVLTGKVSQLNMVPAGTLSLAWGDVAVVVTQEAASGINTVVERFAGREPVKSAASATKPGVPNPGTPDPGKPVAK